MAFAAAGAWEPLIYATVFHNILPASHALNWNSSSQIALALLIFAAACAREIARDPMIEGTGFRAAGILLTAGFLFAYIEFFWPLIQLQTLFSCWPFLALLLAVGARVAGRRLSPSKGYGGIPANTLNGFIQMAACGAALLVLFYILPATARPMSRERRAEQNNPEAQKLRGDPLDPSEREAILADVLKLTDPQDYVMDPKGETVFRRRPFYYAIEHFTLRRMREKQIPDTIAADCIRTRTAVILPSGRYSQHFRGFMDKNYLDVGRLHVAGQYLQFKDPQNPNVAIFEIMVPANYTIIDAQGLEIGRLDGSEFKEARFLSTGRHEFVATHPEKPLALVWTQALTRGFTPSMLPRP